MNKKQSIVAWVSGILIILNCMSPPLQAPWGGRPRRGAPVDLGQFIVNISPILIIGGLLIYTFRDKKK